MISIAKDQCHSIPPNVVEPTPSHTSLRPTSSLSMPSLSQSHQPQPFASATTNWEPKLLNNNNNLTHLNLKRQNIKGEKLCFTEKHEKKTSDSRYSILTVIINRSCFLLAYKTLIPSPFLVGLWFWFWITSKHCEMFSYSVFATAAYLKEKSGLVGQI